VKKRREEGGWLKTHGDDMEEEEITDFKEERELNQDQFKRGGGGEEKKGE